MALWRDAEMERKVSLVSEAGLSASPVVRTAIVKFFY